MVPVVLDTAESREPPEPSAPLTSQLRLDPDGPVVGWLSSPEPLRHAQRDGDDLVIETSFFRPETPGSNHSIAIRARISAAAAAELHPPEPTPPIRTAYHHSFMLLDDRGETLAKARCLETAVLHEDPERTRVRVERDGVVLEGWVAGPVPERGTEDCPARTIRRNALARVTHIDGKPVDSSPEPEPLPPHYRLPAESPPALPPRGSVWWLSRDTDADTWTCQRWRWTRTSKNLQLQHEDGPHLTWYTVEREDGVLTLYGPGWRDRSPGGGRGVAGCVQQLSLVDGDADRWTLLPTIEPFTAYHEADVETWYRTEAACRAAGAAGQPGLGGC